MKKSADQMREIEIKIRKLHEELKKINWTTEEIFDPTVEDPFVALDNYIEMAAGRAGAVVDAIERVNK